MIEGLEGESQTYLHDIELIPGVNDPRFKRQYVRPMGARSASAKALLIEDGTLPDPDLHLQYPIYRFEITLPGHGPMIGRAVDSGLLRSVAIDEAEKKYGRTIAQYKFSANHDIEELRPFKTFEEYLDWFHQKFGSYAAIDTLSFPWEKLSEEEILWVRSVFTDLFFEYRWSFEAVYPDAKQEPVPEQNKGQYCHAFTDWCPKELSKEYWIRIRKRKLK